MTTLHILGILGKIAAAWFLAAIPFALLIGRHLHAVSAMYPEASDE